jgi:hypothetical protein
MERIYLKGSASFAATFYNVWRIFFPELNYRPIFSYPRKFPMKVLFMHNSELLVACTINPNTTHDKEDIILCLNNERDIKCRYHARFLDITNSSFLPLYAVLEEDNILHLFRTGITFPSVEFLVISGSISSTYIEGISKVFPSVIYLAIISRLYLVGPCDFGEFLNLKVLYIFAVYYSIEEFSKISIGPLKELLIKYCSLNLSIDGTQLTEELTNL